VKRLLIATDAWWPQVNGVVRTLEKTREELSRLGIEVTMLTPAGFRTVPMPTYPAIRLVVARPCAIAAKIADAQPEHVHIATEGPLGYAARRWCVRHAQPFTTSFHTRFPEYVSARFPVPERLTYAILRWFHNAGLGCMVSTESLERELAVRGFRNLMRWSRGVDGDLFHPRPDAPEPDLPRPIFLYVGRVSVEKNIAAFVDLDLPGSKMVVGDGPALAVVRSAHPEVRFAGALFGEELARAYATADVFVFPSRTDTFGMVLLEALASGVPVAAFPVPGPIDVIGRSNVGVLSDELGEAALAALSIPRDKCREFALGRSWSAAARQFLDNILSARARAKIAP
jgi:glycosyltransferase involved in cell wall biosynthesis